MIYAFVSSFRNSWGKYRLEISSHTLKIQFSVAFNKIELISWTFLHPPVFMHDLFIGSYYELSFDASSI